jgi:hypothetical protein
VRTEADPSLFARGPNGTNKQLMVLHIDDMICKVSTPADEQAVMEELSTLFNIKKSGNSYVGVEIEKQEEHSTIKIHQTPYARQVLERFGMTDSKPVDTPMTEDKLSKAQGPATPEEQAEMAELKALYMAIIGSLMYLAVWTRPDIAYPVGVLARFNSNPGPPHLVAAKRVLRYIKGTIDHGITYRRYNNKSIKGEVIGYVDADWAGNPDNRRSTTGIVFLSSRGAISWVSKLQTVVADSTAEAEYVSAARATKEAMWLRKVVAACGFPPAGPTILHEDNQACIKIAKNPEQFNRTKHIAIKYHLTRLHVRRGDIALVYVPTNEQAADMFTKALPRVALNSCKQMMGMDTRCKTSTRMQEV